MKFTKLLAAGLAIATLGMGVTAPAEAQRGPDRHYSQHDRGPHHADRRDYRRDDRRDYRRNDHRGRHDDRRYRGRGNDRRDWNNGRRCRTEWRNHRRIQICR